MMRIPRPKHKMRRRSRRSSMYIRYEEVKTEAGEYKEEKYECEVSNIIMR